MFSGLNNALLVIAAALAGLVVAACAVGLAICALLNVMGILDPRSGQAVKSHLLRLLLSAALAGMVPTVPLILSQLGVGGNG